MGQLTPENRKEIVNDALKQMFGAPPKLCAEEQVIDRAKVALTKVRNTINDVVQAAHLAGHPYDQAMAYVTTHKLVIDEFREWSKDDLLFLCGVMNTEILMEAIDEMHTQGLI